MEEKSREVAFVDLPAPVQIQLGIFGPLLFGMIAGFMLGESSTGWWVMNGLATIGGVLGGFEHPGAKAGAGRGLIGGFFFGLGIVIADAIANNAHVVETADPIGLIVSITTIAGIVLGAIGGALAGRAAARSTG